MTKGGFEVENLVVSLFFYSFR